MKKQWREFWLPLLRDDLWLGRLAAIADEWSVAGKATFVLVAEWSAKAWFVLWLTPALVQGSASRGVEVCSRYGFLAVAWAVSLGLLASMFLVGLCVCSGLSARIDSGEYDHQMVLWVALFVIAGILTAFVVIVGWNWLGSVLSRWLDLVSPLLATICI